MRVWSLPFNRGLLLGVKPASASRRMGCSRLALPVDCAIVLSAIVGIDEAPITRLCATFPPFDERKHRRVSSGDSVVR